MKHSKVQLTGSTLKMIAIISMLLDHVAAGILDRILVRQGYTAVSIFNVNDIGTYGDYQFLAIIALICRIIGRIALPIFCFLLVEGCQHTKSISKYVFRLFTFAILSEIPFNLAFRGQWFDIDNQNVFWGLAIGASVIAMYQCMEKIDSVWRKTCGVLGILAGASFIIYLIGGAKWAGKSVFEFGFYVMALLYCIAIAILFIIFFIVAKRKTYQAAFLAFSKLLFLSLGVFVTILISSDYSFGIVLCTSVMYALRGKRVKASLMGYITLLIMDPSELTAILSLVPIKWYNGERGWKMKYFFYAFYPVHLLIIGLIARYLL